MLLAGSLTSLLLSAGAGAPAYVAEERALESRAFARSRAGRLAASTMLFERLLRERPASPRGCLWAEGLLLNAIARDDAHAMQRAAARLSAQWGRLRGADELPERLRRVCRDDAAHGLQYLAYRWHNEGGDRCDLARLELAEWAYREFLAVFPMDPAAYDMQFYLAELYVRRGRIEQKFARFGPNSCRWITCGTAERARRQRRRAAGIVEPRCASAAALERGDDVEEPAYCPWYRRAATEYRHTLELNPEGRWTKNAAAAHVSMSAALTSWHERNVNDACKITSEGICVSRASDCRVQDGCYDGAAHPRRYPSVGLAGVGPKRPPPRMP